MLEETTRQGTVARARRGERRSARGLIAEARPEHVLHTLMMASHDVECMLVRVEGTRKSQAGRTVVVQTMSQLERTLELTTS